MVQPLVTLEIVPNTLTDVQALDGAVLGLLVSGVAGAHPLRHGPVAVAVAVRAQAVLVVQAGHQT